MALVAGRDNADAAAPKTAPSNISTAVLYTDGMIIRLAQDDESDSTTQSPANNDDTGDDSGPSNPPAENPQ
jgi:hypothetical protein